MTWTRGPAFLQAPAAAPVVPLLITFDTLGPAGANTSTLADDTPYRIPTTAYQSVGAVITNTDIYKNGAFGIASDTGTGFAVLQATSRFTAATGFDFQNISVRMDWNNAPGVTVRLRDGTTKAYVYTAGAIDAYGTELFSATTIATSEGGSLPAYIDYIEISATGGGFVRIDNFQFY